MKENLWWKSISSFWADPRNVIGPPGALVRRIVKCLWMALSVYVLFFIAGPSQVASWRLWMHDQGLAQHIAWGFTFAAALCFAVVGYTAELTKPVRMPIPMLEFEGSLRNVRIHTTHMHLPNIRVALGSMLAAALFVIALLGQWNYYLHDNLSASGAAVAALDGAGNGVAEADQALKDHDASTARALANIDAAIAATPANYPTGRSRLAAQRTALTVSAANERRQLVRDLNAARASNVTTHQTAADPRPVDGQVAGALHAPRDLVSSLLDLLRSGVVEALLVMGAGLGLVGGMSRIGVPEGEADFAPAPPREEEVLETEPAPEAQPDPVEEPTSRYVLPSADDQDVREAVAVGPHEAAAPAPEQPEAPTPEAAPEPSVAPANTQEEAIDPLLAAELG